MPHLMQNENIKASTYHLPNTQHGETDVQEITIDFIIVVFITLDHKIKSLFKLTYLRLSTGISTCETV